MIVVWVLRYSRSGKLTFPIAGTALVLSMLISGCTGLIPSANSDDPLIALPLRDSSKERGSDRNTSRNAANREEAITGGSARRDSSAEQSQVQFGSGQFVQQPRNISGADVTGDGEVELNFAEANVREVAQSILGNILGQNFIVDTSVDQRITLRTNRPLKKANLLPTLETTLAAAGLALVKEGDVYRILPGNKAKVTKSTILASKGYQPAGYGVTVVRLEHIAPSQMAKIVEPLAPEKSILRIDDPRNLMILSATGPEMKALLETIETFDVSPLKGMSFGYFKLRNARASQVSSELRDLIKAYRSQSGFNAPEIVPIDRMNALLVFASRPENLKLIQGWISRLDEDKNEAEANLYVYRVKNRKAKELAAIVSSLFQNGGEANGPKGSDVAPDTKSVELTSALAGPDPIRNTAPPDTGRAEVRTAGGLRVVADSDNNSLLIRATPAQYHSMLAALTRLDTVPPQVLVEVTIAEVTLNDGLQYGVEWFFKKGRQSTTLSGIDTGQILSKFPGFSYFFNAVDVQVVLNAVANVTNVKVLSSPKVMVLDNRTATLQIGDQVPIITSTSQSVTAPDAPVIQTVQYYKTRRAHG